MKTTLFVSLFILVFLALGTAPSAYSLDPPSTPNIDVRDGQDYYLKHVPEAPSCNILMKAVGQVVRFANEKFKERRAWATSFLRERFKVARKFSDRSQYVMVYEGSSAFPSPNDPLAGTIGVTYARYTKEDASEIIPIEDIKEFKQFNDPLPRPTDEDGNGIIFELRAYAKDKDHGEKAFPSLLQGAYRLIFEKLKDHPDLYDKDIIYLYGDDLSVRFYSHFGFHVVEDIPSFTHKDTKWRVMAASPKSIEAQAFTFKQWRYFKDFNQPIPLLDDNGRKFWAAPHTEVWTNGDGTVERATPTDDLEVAPGVFASKNLQIDWWATDRITRDYKKSRAVKVISVRKISRPAYLPKLKIWIPAGSAVEVYGGKVAQASNLGAPVFVPTLGITIPAGGLIDVSDDPQTRVSILEGREVPHDQISTVGVTEPFRIQPGVWAPAGGTEIVWKKLPSESAYKIFHVRNTFRAMYPIKGFARQKNTDYYVLADGTVLPMQRYYNWIWAHKKGSGWIPDP